MHCSRCGAVNEPGDRFCSSCGATLGKPSAPAERQSPRERLGQAIGTTRKARIVTLATIVALIVAIVSLIALKPADDNTIPRDAYTIAADRQCLAAKRQIALAERRSLKESDPGALAETLLPIVATWQSSFRNLEVPSDRLSQAEKMNAALTQVEVEIGALARAAAAGSRAEILASARRADLASASVEDAASELGLSRCANARISLAPQT